MLTAPYINPTMKRPEDEKVTMIDYTNLYIKNLDREVDSSKLFELFRVFGEIVSARVMKDTQTGISRGYGFVSFKQMEGAQEALRHMNGVRLYTKHISVSYHEHKKVSPSNIHRNPTFHPTQQEPSFYPTPDKNFIQPWQETIWMQPSNGYMMPMPTVTSPMTPPMISIQEHKLREVIDSQLSGPQKRDLNDLVELIQSLDRRELSLCLFNTSFLKQQIDKAYEVIHLFRERQPPVSASLPTTPSLDHQHLEEDEDSQSVTALLATMEGMSVNKKKRFLGDILFPLVKSTGIRYAPKVTIYLLDTVALDELTCTMHNKQQLAQRAHQAYVEIHGEDSNPYRKTN
ncbi:hypothetical protein BY458DRAFT_512356 [Sporodiniella umbellata]|nr:hypothetical protein BY458DRAFT_512356 [Sporodiniella umbellata]